jgi:RHS repeat-associated protein
MKLCVIRLLIAMLVSLMFSSSALGQTSPLLPFQATRYMPGQEVANFATFAEAKAWIKQEPATAIGNQYLEAVSSNTFGLNGEQTIVKYQVKFRVPKQMLGSWYGINNGTIGKHHTCNGGVIPYLSGNVQFDCPSEAAAQNAFLTGNPGFTLQWVGAYGGVPPTRWGPQGDNIIGVYPNSLDEGGTRDVKAFNSNGDEAFVYSLGVDKLDLYQCDALFLGTTHLGTYVGGKAKWPYVCHNPARAEIVFKTGQYATSCEINTKDGNPCVAGTGNKEYREKDFDWEGVAFTRAYNSVADMLLLSGMGDNWAHSFSDRLITDSVAGYQWIRSDGYYEDLRYLNATTYKSIHTTGMLMYVESDAVALTHGRFRIAMRNGKQLWFGETGRLLRSEHGSQTLTYQYCTTAQIALGTCTSKDLLTKITSSSGRSLSFEYATINVPVGIGSNTREELRLSRIHADGVTLVNYAYDTQARLIHAAFAGVANHARDYLYAESTQLCRDAVGSVIAGCNVANYPNHLTGVVDEKGNRYASYTYDEKSRVTGSEHAGATGRVGLVYQTNGNVQVSLPTGTQKVYQFNADAFRKPTQVGINDAANGSVKTTLATYSGGRIASMTEPNNARVNFTYDAIRLTGRTEALTATGATTPQTRTTQTDWHASFNVPTERRVLNAANVLEARTTYTHNARGQTTAMCQIDPNNPAAMAYVCGSATNAPVGVRQSTMTYCEQADVTAGTCPIVGLMLSSNGPRTDVSDISTYTYYQADAASCATAPTTCAYRKGDLWKVTNALNHVMETTAYDGAGRVLQMKDANNVITDMQYHPRGWLTHRKVRGSDNATEADDAITTMDYDATGQVTKVTQPDGDFITFTYDAAHRLTGISDALNNSITYTLDNAGNRTAETTKDPSNVIKRSLSRVYDTLGRLQASKNAASATVATLTNDANDNLNTSTDGLNRITDQDVDPLNRLIKTIQDQGAGKINATTQFEYDARDNLTKVIDPKNLNTVYSYNGLNDLTQLSSPDTGVTSFTYDAAGNRKTQTDARNVTSTYSYDSANRLTQVSLPTAAQNVFFDYDATQTDCQANETFTTGRLARIRDESGSTRYCYNRLGQSVRKVQSVTGGPNLSLGSTYNGANRMIAMTYPSGAIVTYLRNAKGQITGIDAKPTAAAAQVSLVSNATYLPFGPLNTITFGNTRVLTKAYDQNYDIDKVSDNSPTGLSQDSTVNIMGNITAITERTTATANTTRQFAYDNLDRLLSLKNGATNIQSFTYDATGNRLNKTLGTTVTTNTIAATSHRLTQDGATARTYDANGNTATIGVKGYVYDDRNRLRDYKNSGSTVTRTYRYNGKGERVSKVQAPGNANNRYYFYDEAGHLLGEYLANGTRVQEYVWLDDQLIAVLSDHDASTYQFVETDHLGTPRAVIHPAENNIVWRWNITNTAFGEHAATNNPDADAVTYTFNLRYPGQYYDSESGTHYNINRDYEPGGGRYVQSDPIGLKGGVNTFAYSLSTPFMVSDPLGLAPNCVRSFSIAPPRFIGERIYENSQTTIGFNCKMIPKLRAPDASDLYPDPRQLARYGRWRAGIPIPVGFDFECYKIIKSSFSVFKIMLTRTSYYETCTDDCGNVGPTKLIKHIDNTHREYWFDDWRIIFETFSSSAPPPVFDRTER